MQKGRDRVATLKQLRARAAEFLTPARETDDVWFAEQLSRLAKHLGEYADTLEAEVAHRNGAQTVSGSPVEPRRE